MTKQRHSIDGFVPRRPGSQLGSSDVRQSGEADANPGRFYRPGHQERQQPTTLKRSDLGIARTDISESLQGIDSIDEPLKKGKRGRGKGAPRSKLRRIIKWIIILLIVTVVAIGGWIAYKALHAGSNIFKGSIFDIIQSQPLKQDANGRSNILILGTSEDDPGHEAGNLTDSIMILSVDQNKKNAFMISIPRDLYVQYGQACSTGYAGKINVYYSCVGGGDSIEKDRTALTSAAGFMGTIVGLDIQYGVNVNYTVMRDLVDAVGGITVTIESRDPRGVMDSNFDWKCGVGDRKVSRAEQLRRCPPNGHFIDLPNGPVNLNAEQALYLAQARGDSAPTYGLEQSNFDREKNQQKILKALREKAVSVGVLTDFGKVSKMLDTLGNNLRTTFEEKEVRTLMSLAKDIKSADIKSISLIDGDSQVMTTGMTAGQSIVEPSAGLYNYSALQQLIRETLSNNPVTQEKAKVAVFNGSGVGGVAQTEADKLAKEGFVIGAVDNAPSGTYGNVEVYQISQDKPATKAKLESYYNVKVKTTAPPVSVADGTSFVVIIGKDRSSNN